MERYTYQSSGGWEHQDFDLNPAEREDLFEQVARVYRDQETAEGILRRIGFPRDRRPAWTGNTTPESWWRQIFDELESGIIAPPPFLRLLAAVLRAYEYHPVLRPIAIQYGVLVPEGPEEQAPEAERPDAEAPQDETPQAVAQPEQACHVIVRTGSEDLRSAAFQQLGQLDLDPQEEWSTPDASSYRVNSADTDQVRLRLDRTDLGWVVVPPGQPDYLLRQLFVQGPDGTTYQLTDAPAQQRVADVAASVVGQYNTEFADGSRPTVVDHVGPDGQGQRLDPEETLHDAGVRDGDSLRVGMEARAGAVNPIDRQNALDRVRNEIVAYRDKHPGFDVKANSPTLPTEYEFGFQQRSFGPPPPGGQPVVIEAHEVLVQLGPAFPETPPTIFWLTPIFHPNVFPNYDCETLRWRPSAKGLVCLGVLAESYVPSLDFGVICQLLVDLAGYRNYELFEMRGTPGADGSNIRANYYNRDAAQWALKNEEAITAIGGTTLSSRGRPARHYPNRIEVITA